MKKIIVVFLHMFVGWALCGAIIGIGQSLTTMETTLIVHAIGVPVIFTIISFIYFRFFHFTRPLTTALLFLSFAVVMDVFVVALLIEKSFDMFRSPLGTWIPFGLIFLSTYFTSFFVSRNQVEQP
jgi:hypothetical protein